PRGTQAWGGGPPGPAGGPRPAAPGSRRAVGRRRRRPDRRRRGPPPLRPRGTPPAPPPRRVGPFDGHRVEIVEGGGRRGRRRRVDRTIGRVPLGEQPAEGRRPRPTFDLVGQRLVDHGGERLRSERLDVLDELLVHRHRYLPLCHISILPLRPPRAALGPGLTERTILIRPGTRPIKTEPPELRSSCDYSPRRLTEAGILSTMSSQAGRTPAGRAFIRPISFSR